MSVTVSAPPASLADTRLALHRLAVYVVSPWRRARTGRIGLRVTGLGIGTPPTGDDEARLQITPAGLVAGDRHGSRTHPFTSLADAARIAGVAPDLEAATRFDVPPPGDLEAPLDPDPAAVEYLIAWYRFGQRLLEGLIADAGPGDAASEIQLWPEHFDLACEIGAEPLRIGFGASPGDTGQPEPYVYAAPWTVPDPGDDFWDPPHRRYRAMTAGALAAAPDPLAAARGFLETCRAHVRSTTGGAR